MRSSLQTAAAAALFVLVAACGDSSGPKIGPPSKVDITASPTTTGSVHGSVGTFAVKVGDDAGHGVSGVAVTFAASGGGGIAFAPATMTTDATGTARTVVTLGTLAGTSTISATATGVPTAATVTLTTSPGAVATLVASPAAIRLSAVGDTARIAALVQDEFANTVSGATLAYAIADPTLVSIDTGGLVRALRVGGTTSVIASSSGRSDTVTVAVLAPGSSPCTGVVSPSVLAVGAISAVSGSTLCLLGGAATSDYTIIAYNDSLDGSLDLSASILGNGLATPPSSFRAPSGAQPLAVRSPLGAQSSAAPVLDESFHVGLLASARSMRSHFADARAAHAARLSASRGAQSRGGFSPSASYASIPSVVAVGDTVTLNTNGSVSCSSPKNRLFRVAAVGVKSIVLADTTNPKNGFTDADYARFAARFDTLVYPLDVSNFGAPSDIDANGKVAILFTKSVNELTPANTNSFVGGFFHPRDLFPKTAPSTDFACATSNEGEMFYMLVPDPSGTVNGNRRTLGFVDSLTTGVIAHEFQHLINAGLRLYGNTGAQDFEDTWLNEALSHVAEELLYYRESGMQPRQHLSDADIRVNSRATYPLWKADALSNFQRLIEYLQDPGGNSLMSDVDALATRGASWSFLRYAVDRTFPSDAGVWSRFTHSANIGLGTLSDGLQTSPNQLLADFAVANYVTDLGLTTDPRYGHKSWNFRDIFAHTFISLGGYPLQTIPLTDNNAAQLSVQGGSASYYRLSVAAGKEALITFSSGGGAPNKSFKFTVVRTN